jgi:hypothetical protein
MKLSVYGFLSQLIFSSIDIKLLFRDGAMGRGKRDSRFCLTRFTGIGSILALGNVG